MRLLLCALAIAFIGCGGAIGASNKPPPTSVDFISAVQVTPSVVVPRRRISVNIDLTNTGNLAVDASIDLLVHDAAGGELYTQTWEDVQISAKETWNLTQGFVPPTNAGNGTGSVELVIRGQADDAIYYDEPQAASF